MIYKLFNYVKGVTIENESGIQCLAHDCNCYKNQEVCVEVKEVAHNEIQLKVLKAECPIHHIHVDFLNPMENVKGIVDSCGNVQPINETDEQENKCLIYSDYGTYALGLENGFDMGGIFKVDPNEIHLSFSLESDEIKSLPCYRLIFEKYLAVHSGDQIIERFNHCLGY